MELDEDKLLELLSELFPLEEDLKVELIAALLYKELGSSFSIVPIGSYRRPYRKDLHKVSLAETKANEPPIIHYEANRNGLYDHLPQMLFHKASTNNQLPDSDSFERQVKYNEEQESRARKLFQPLESVFYDIRTLLMVQEVSLLKNQFQEYEQSNFIGDFWNFHPSFTDEDKSILVHILPFLVNNKNQVESINFCLSRLCGNDIELIYRSGREIKFKSESDELSLVDARLGYNTVLGSTYYDENALWAEVKIGLHSVDEYPGYLDNNRQRKLIDFVMSYILPMEMEYELSFEIMEQTPTNQDDSLSASVVLGINADLENFTL